MSRLVGAATLAVASSIVVLPITASAEVEVEARGMQRVAIASLDFDPHIPAGVRELLSQRLVEGLAAARFEVLRGRDVEQKLRATEPELLGCKDAGCYPKLASALKVGYLLAARVSESNKTYAMVVEIINGRTGAVLAVSRDRCETCGAEEAGEKMGLASSAVRQRLETVSRAPARFVVRSRPAGASVILDGKAVGSTPFDVELPGGEHRMRLQLDGFAPLERSFTVVSSVDEALDLDLVALPTRFPYRAAGWSALGGGGLLAAAGIGLLIMHGDDVACSASDQDAVGHCPERWSTKWWGAALLGVGVAATALGGVMLFLAPQPASSGAGAMAGVSGSF